MSRTDTRKRRLRQSLESMKEQSGAGYRPSETTQKPRNLDESFQQYHEQSAEELLREDAARRGMEWHVYCRKFGIMGSAAKARAKRHEVKYSPVAADLNPREME